MCLHMYNWNIVECDVKQPIHSNPSYCFTYKKSFTYDENDKRHQWQDLLHEHEYQLHEVKTFHTSHYAEVGQMTKESLLLFLLDLGEWISVAHHDILQLSQVKIIMFSKVKIIMFSKWCVVVITKCESLLYSL